MVGGRIDVGPSRAAPVLAATRGNARPPAGSRRCLPVPALGAPQRLLGGGTDVSAPGARLVAVGPAARHLWRDALPHDPDALVWQTPTWMDCVCESGRYEDATRAYATSDGH